MSEQKRHDGLEWLKSIYFLGSFVAVVSLIASEEGKAFALIFLLWGGLILASTHLALKKGREFVEGMVLGAFGPIGFIIEVLLPATKPQAPEGAVPK